MKYKFLQKSFIIIAVILSAIFTSLSAYAGSSDIHYDGDGGNCGFSVSSIPGLTSPVTTEIMSITTKGLGTTVTQLYVNTQLTANKDSLPELKEYICILSTDNQLKATIVVDAQIDGNSVSTRITGSFDISTDYIRIFVWDDNMKPYSNGINMPLKDITRSIPATSGGGIHYD